MLHPDRPRIRGPALAILALAASLSAQGSPLAPDAEAMVQTRSTSVGGGIGYGVDAERQHNPVVAQARREPAQPPLVGIEEGAPWRRSARRGYVGVGVGQSAFDADCGAGGFDCKRARPALHLFAGSMWDDTYGLELGYRFMGRAERGGGHTEAQSVGVSLVGRLAMGPLSVFAKAGLAYGRTRVSADPVSRLPTSQEGGWSGTWGTGLSWGLTPASALLLEWASVELPMGGAGRSAIENTSIGFLHHF